MSAFTIDDLELDQLLISEPDTIDFFALSHDIGPRTTGFIRIPLPEKAHKHFGAPTSEMILGDSDTRNYVQEGDPMLEHLCEITTTFQDKKTRSFMKVRGTGFRLEGGVVTAAHCVFDPTKLLVNVSVRFMSKAEYWVTEVSFSGFYYKARSFDKAFLQLKDYSERCNIAWQDQAYELCTPLEIIREEHNKVLKYKGEKFDKIYVYGIENGLPKFSLAEIGNCTAYVFSHTGDTLPGTSGGPIVGFKNDEPTVIGIHIAAIAEFKMNLGLTLILMKQIGYKGLTGECEVVRRWLKERNEPVTIRTIRQ